MNSTLVFALPVAVLLVAGQVRMSERLETCATRGEVVRVVQDIYDKLDRYHAIGALAMIMMVLELIETELELL